MVVHSLVRQIRTNVSIRIHANGCTIHDDIIFLDNLGRDGFVLDGVGPLVSADENGI